MKIAIISDIHGNVQALDAVLSELKKENIDKILCLGDCIGGNSRSEEVVQRLISLGNKLLVVKGNREKYIIEGMPEFIHEEKIRVTDEQINRNKWIKNRLSDLSIKFINSLPKELTYDVGKFKIYMAHYPMKDDGSFRKHIRGASLIQNEEMFFGIDANIYLYGHTHEEIYNSNNEKIYINPGALGCPLDTNFAPYGILYINDNDVHYEQLHAEYDVQGVIDDIKNLKFPGYKSILETFFYV